MVQILEAEKTMIERQITKFCFNITSKLSLHVRRCGELNPNVNRSLSTSSEAFMKLYSDKHEWVEQVESSSNVVRVGITQYAADALGDVVYAQLPETDSELLAGEECGALESVKAASELYSPVSGLVVDNNTDVEDKPALINSSAESSAWLFEVRLSNVQELENLMNQEKYKRFLESITDDLE